MALELKKNDKYGNSGVSYWKVIEINRNLLTNTARVVLAGYVDAEARQEGKLPIDWVAFNYTSDNNPFTLEKLNEKGVNAVSVAYEEIKKDEQFVGAKDV